MIIVKTTLLPMKEQKPFHYVQISDALQAQCHTSLTAKANFQCSSKTISARVSFIHDERPVILANQAFYQELYLPFTEIPIQVSYDHKTNTFSFGPIIAILTDVIQKKKSVYSFGSIHEFCEEIASYSKQYGAFIYVAPLSKFQEEVVEGYFYEDGDWKQDRLPLPHVIHNRIHSRRFELSHKYKNFTEELTKQNIPIFNHRFLNKWEIQGILAENSHLQPYLPKTALIDSKGVLQTYLADFQHVFVKPIHGSQGRNILQIRQHPDFYEVKDSSHSENTLFRYDLFGELFESLYVRFKKEPYIVQERIPVITYNNRPLDFRILCHKTGPHKWKITSAVARVSAENQFVSNIAKGGELYRLKTILLELFDSSTSYHIRKLLYEISLEAAHVISQQTIGDYAELGIDIAITADGKPWILEVNTKPSKNMDMTKSITIRPSAKAVADYCFFLSGYERKKGSI